MVDLPGRRLWCAAPIDLGWSPAGEAPGNWWYPPELGQQQQEDAREEHVDEEGTIFYHNRRNDLGSSASKSSTYTHVQGKEESPVLIWFGFLFEILYPRAKAN